MLHSIKLLSTLLNNIIKIQYNKNVFFLEHCVYNTYTLIPNKLGD